jgi:hypothetical protein
MNNTWIKLGVLIFMDINKGNATKDTMNKN